MKNKDLMQDLVEKWGEEKQLDMIANRSLQLALSISDYRKANFHEDREQYNKTYNDVCERIADMKLMIEQAEFLFNSNTINQHYEIKAQGLTEALNQF